MSADFPEPVWPVDLDRCRIWPMESEDGPLLQELFDDLGDFEPVFGPRGSADAVSTFLALPEGVGYESKLLLGLWTNGLLVGVVDCIIGYPTAAAWTVGALVIAERHRGRGIGRSVLRWLESVAVDHGAAVLRVVVRDTNRAGQAFLQSSGYQSVDAGPPTAREAVVRVLARPLGPAPQQ